MNMGVATCQDANTRATDAVGPHQANMRDVYLGMHLFRASSLSLTHLQLALRHGDRKRILESVDQLHECDVRISRLLQSLPVSLDEDPELHAVRRQIEAQSVAVSFEKLSLVSGISGPDMVSPVPKPCAEGDPPPVAAIRPEPPAMVAEERRQKRIYLGMAIGLGLAVLGLLGVIAAPLLAS